MADEDDDNPEDLMALSRHALFDTGPARAVCPSTFRRDVPIEPSEEIPLHQADGTREARFGSKFLSMGVGTQRIEGRFDARNVTKPIVAAGHVTDAGQGVWPSGNGEFLLDVKSAKKLLGDRRGFMELRKQKDMDEVEAEEDKPAKVKSAPVLPTDKEREEHEVTHATFRSWCEACVTGRATEDAHKRSSTESSVPSMAMDNGFLGRNTDADLATILVLVQRPHGAVGA